MKVRIGKVQRTGVNETCLGARNNIFPGFVRRQTFSAQNVTRNSVSQTKLWLYIHSVPLPLTNPFQNVRRT